jgi:hypothetical protein
VRKCKDQTGGIEQGEKKENKEITKESGRARREKGKKNSYKAVNN